MTYAILPGTVYFVGAGPGAPDLITLRGHAIIAQADLVLYADSLVEESVAAIAGKPDAHIIATSTMNLDEIVPLMIAAARAGKIVARVHSGDPALYGAMHEQMVVLERAEVNYVVVPGVPSAFAAAALLGVELTVPDLVQSVILTRAAGRVAMPSGEHLRGLAAHGTSLAIHLSVTRVRQVVEELITSGGYTVDSPVAVLHKVSWPDESYVLGTLGDIVAKVKAAGYTRHALILVSPALDGALKHREDQAVSHLYDRTWTHRFRRGVRSQDSGVGDQESGAPESQEPRTETPETQNSKLKTQNSTVVISVTRRGAALAAQLAAQLDADLAVPTKFADDNRQSLIANRQPFDDSVLAEIRRRWGQHRALVLVMATGVAVRAIAPLAAQKANDPAVICLDEAGRVVIPLLGGHQADANDLARRIAALTGGQAAITTASDGQGKPALDTLGKQDGWRIAPDSALTRAMAALVNDEPVGVFVEAGNGRREAGTSNAPAHLDALLEAENVYQVEAVSDLLSEDYTAALIVSHRELGEAWGALRHKSVLYRSPVLVAGIGCRRGVPVEELRAALETTLRDAGFALASVGALATVDLKADEPGLHALAAALGVPLQIVARAQLADLDPAQFSPSAAQEKFDIPGVAEPCALLVSGGEIVVPKRAFERVTVAIAVRRRTTDDRRPTDAMVGNQEPRIKNQEPKNQEPTHSVSASSPPASLSLVSIGPGDLQQMTLAAREALQAADVVIGYRFYVDQVRPLLRAEQEIVLSPIGDEVGRAQQAIELAATGRRVALVSSGDIGVYAMAGPVFEVLRAHNWRGVAPEVQVLPGVSAMQAAAAQLGAPLAHDFCTISLSDLLTPWDVITQRVAAAARGDFVIAFYNPRSRDRNWQLAAALDILREHRPPTTPVALIRNVTRADEAITLTTLADVRADDVDMWTLVLVGSSQSYTLGGRMATPRGYTRAPLTDAARAEDSAHATVKPAAVYPVMLNNVRGAPVVVVGGGAVGERKVRGLLAVGAAVRVISPQITPALHQWHEQQQIVWQPRAYQTGDLADARLAFAATNQRAINAAVADEARRCGVLCNIADDPAASDFHLPAVHRTAELIVAVSTAGASPTRAVQARDAIAGFLDEGRRTTDDGRSASDE